MININFKTLTNETMLIEDLQEIALKNFKKGKILSRWKDIISNNHQLEKLSLHPFENKDLSKIYYSQIQEQYALKKMYQGHYESYMKNEKRFELELFSVLIQLLNIINFENEDESKYLLHYLELLNSSDKFKPNNSITFDFHPHIVQIIKKLLNNHKETKIENKILEKLFNLYFYYPLAFYNFGYIPLYDEIVKEIALLIPDFIKKYPNNVGNLVQSLFEGYYPEPIKEYTSLILYYLEHSSKVKSISILNEIFSRFNEKDNIFTKNSPKILSEVIKKFDFQDNDVDFFCNQILNCLNIQTEDEYIKHLEEHIKSLQALENFDKQLLQKREKEAKISIQNAQKNVYENYQMALKYCIKSKPTKKSIGFIVDSFKQFKEVKKLSSFYNDIISKENITCKYQINKQPNIEFKDFHFKLLVIQELMYNKELLSPKLILSDFVDEYINREISIEIEGYKIIPEIKKYFKNLNIDEKILAQIETLDIDYEFGGMYDILENMWPFWDPGCGDDKLYISNNAITDIKHLPNLKKIIGINFTKINKNNEKILQNLGITLVDGEVF